MEERVEQLFYSALEQEPSARAAFLDSACRGDAELRREIDSLLECDGQAEPLFSAALQRLAGTLSDPAQGERVGPYRLRHSLGQGGMGSVYLAERADGQFEQQVAIKFVAGGPSLAARFHRERRILARLQHPGIARLIDGGITGQGLPYMVMEYFPGVPITEHCQAHHLPPAERLALFRDVCAAVEYAHRNLVIHRDLKPANILVTDTGQVKLLDFGIARLLEPAAEDAQPTATGMHWLTPDYASPEQVRGGPVTTATDIYSLGAILFELLTGTRPHKLSSYTPAEITEAICAAPPPSPHLGNELDHIVGMAMRKEPGRRYLSVTQFSEDINRFLSHHPVIARPDTAAYRLRKFVRRNRVAVTAATLGVLALAAGLGVARHQAQQAQHRFAQLRKLASTVLFDLDPKIRDLVGATEARALLVKTAQQYLDSLYADAQDDDTLLAELAAAYERVADVQGEPARPNLGQRSQAIRNYHQAVAIREKLAAHRPADTAAWLALSRACQKLYDVEGKEEVLRRGAEIASRALSAHPADPEAYALSIGAANRLGGRRLNRSDGTGALVHFQQARAIAEEWVRRMPGDQSRNALASVLSRIAVASTQKGDPAAAVEILHRLIAIREQFAAREPGNADYQRALFKACFLMGDALGNPEQFNLGQVAEAAAMYRRALAIAERLLAADSKNALARGDVSDANWALALTLRDQDPRLAAQLLRRSLDEALVVLRGSPQTLSFIHNAAVSHIALAGAIARLGDRRGALLHLRKGLEMQREVARAAPQQPGLRHNMIGTLTQLGDTLLDAGDPTAAAAYLEEALAISETVQRDNAFVTKIPDIAACYAALGRLHSSRREWQAAREWYGKSLDLWRELEKRGIPLAYTAPKKRLVRDALAACPR